MKKNKLLLIGIVCLAFVFASNVTFAAFQYPLLEAIPGFYARGDTSTDFPGLILSIYKFGIWTVGIAGLFMLVIGGFMYMGSAGNTSVAGSAKNIITDALLGIVAAMLAYLVLYVINPDLTTISIKFAPAITVHEGVNKVYQVIGNGRTEPARACTDASMINRMKADSVGVVPDPCLTFALLSTESGCNPNAQSSVGACGISQMMPKTAGQSCEYLKSNVDEAIKMGAKKLWDTTKQNAYPIRGSLTQGTNPKQVAQAIRDLYAAYNGGLGALGKSKDCASNTQLNDYGNPFVKWDCPNNPGGYVETVRATTEFLTFYNKCKDNNLMK